MLICPPLGLRARYAALHNLAVAMPCLPLELLTDLGRFLDR